MNKRDRKRIEKKLLEERERLASSLGKLESSVLKGAQREASGDLSSYSIHSADPDPDAVETEKDLQVASAEGRRLLEIEQALRRLNDKDFGTCESCGKQIEYRRLQAVPQARLCLKCQEKAERSTQP